jgi:DNA-binding IclR family transcriptional regulator
VENLSLVKALAVIETLAASPHSLTAVQLSRRLKFTRSAVYRILQTLASRGFAIREEGESAYHLSFKLLELGHQLLERSTLLETARPILARLRTRAQETVHLAVPENGQMVYLDKLEGAGPLFCVHSRLGRRVPMHCTALGKAVLGFLPAGRAREVLAPHGLQRYTRRTIATWARLERELARVQRQGYAIDDVEFEAGVRCVGAPILDQRGVPVAAISVSAPASRMALSRAHAVGVLVHEGAAFVSRALGWRATLLPLPAAGSRLLRKARTGRAKSPVGGSTDGEAGPPRPSARGG